MTLIPDLSDIPDLEPVAPGEYDLTITKVIKVESNKTGRTGIKLVCNILGEDNAETLFHGMWFPMESDDKEKTELLWRMIKEFCTGLGLDTSNGLNEEDFIGLTFSAVLDIEDTEFGRANIIKRIT